MANAKLRRIQPPEIRPETEPYRVVDALLEEWKFFIPEPPLTRRILALREQLGDSYFEQEYESFKAKASDSESHDDLQDASSLPEQNSGRKGFLQNVFDQVSTIFGFARDEGSREESVALYQSFISETIYDHLAMLGRSPGTMKGHAFSIRKELTEGIAEEIGLGLYLTPEIGENLHHQSESALLELAGDYQKWLVEERQGICETTWGYICSSQRELTEEMRNSQPLILIPDVTITAAVAQG